MESLSAVAAPAGARVGRFRWVVCALLFFATTVNYVDRQVLGILAPDLQRTIGWSEVEYGYIVTAFQGAYALGLLVTGRLLDRVGTRLGYALAITLWSLAAMAHALARSAFGFGAARFALGLGEAANFPAAIKTVAEWFPKKERAFATGIFNAGTNIGAVIAPAIVPWIALNLSWQWAFILTGAIGFFWLALWWIVYRPPEVHPRLSAAEFAFIRSDAEEKVTPVPWLALMGYRQTWAFALGKFMTDPIWWFYLYWLPKFLNETHGLTLSKMGPPLIAIYLIADVGSVGGGWVSSFLIKRGWSINAARKTTMLICALCVVPIVFAPRVASLWGAVALVGLATAAHQGWSANIFTLASDMFPRRAVGSVVGFGGMAGSVGGMLISTLVGYLLQWTGSYVPVFLLAGSAYLAALVVIQVLAPRLQAPALDEA
jgi:MFS transporter, ACS family, aldohexuronate transporter